MQHFVKVGATRGDQIAIDKGVAAGDEVVTGGQLKLRSGAAVIVNNKVVPTNDVTPTPPNECKRLAKAPVNSPKQVEGCA